MKRSAATDHGAGTGWRKSGNRLLAHPLRQLRRLEDCFLQNIAGGRDMRRRARGGVRVKCAQNEEIDRETKQLDEKDGCSG